MNSFYATCGGYDKKFPWFIETIKPFPGVCLGKKGAGSCQDPALVRSHGRLFGRRRLGNWRSGRTLASQAASLAAFRLVTHLSVETAVRAFRRVAFHRVGHELRQLHAGLIRIHPLQPRIRHLFAQVRQLTPRIQRRLHFLCKLIHRHPGELLRWPKLSPGIYHRLQFGCRFSWRSFHFVALLSVVWLWLISSRAPHCPGEIPNGSPATPTQPASPQQPIIKGIA